MDDLDWLKAAVLILAVIFGLMVVAYNLDTARRKKDKVKLRDEIDNLDTISSTLKILAEYIKDQKHNLLEHERAIEELEEKRSEQSKIIEADENLVNALFEGRVNFERKFQRKTRWFNRFIGFVLGLLSSAIVAYVFANYY